MGTRSSWARAARAGVAVRFSTRCREIPRRPLHIPPKCKLENATLRKRGDSFRSKDESLGAKIAFWFSA